MCARNRPDHRPDHHPFAGRSGVSRWSILVNALMITASGCALPLPESTIAVEPIATPEESPADLRSDPQPTVSAIPGHAEDAWTEIGVGLELRTQMLRPNQDRPAVRLITLRVSPDHHVVDVAYRPEQPLDLATWQLRTGAPIVFNSGYFTEEFIATGLVVAGGRTYGSSYGGFAGMLAVTAAGPEVRWLGSRPYNPSEPLAAAIQAFPMLVLPGSIRGFDEVGGEVARRTAIGQDTAGRLVVIVAPDGGFTLSELSAALVASDLSLDTALNLDGGSSTGLIIEDPPVRVEAFGLLPAVITIRPKAFTAP